MTGLKPIRCSRFTYRRFGFVAGWGMKETAAGARGLASRNSASYISIEDGFLRSIRPGAQERPLSLVIDRMGVHYDARRPSDLERIVEEVAASPTEELVQRAIDGISLLKATKVSKYNTGPLVSAENLGLAPRTAAGRVLVVDQTYGDSSIEFGLASGESFQAMLEAAKAENPGAEIIVKTHPEVISGAKSGYLAHLADESIKLIGANINPWSLIDVVDRVYVVTSQLGFEALVAGKKVTCFGAPFYAGWGLTDDRVEIERRTARPTLEQLFAAVYFRYSRYLDPYEGRESTFERTVETLAFLRDRHLENDVPSVCVNISRWKRSAVTRFLDGFAGKPVYAWTVSSAIRRAKAVGGQVVTWASKCTKRLEEKCASVGVPLVRIEDGFVRSVGLGAALKLPYSLSIDRSGIYYDSTRPSDLEHLLETAEVDPVLLARAVRIRDMLVSARLSKYNVGDHSSARWFAPGRTGILVPGQVANDASVLAAVPYFADGRTDINLALLRAVRERNPGAYIVYKPHPDVEAGKRPGRLAERDVLAYADRVAADTSILPLIAQCDRVETLSSQSGFEALMRGKPVTTFGMPFYAGWGLTEDHARSLRRTRTRTLDELVAIALVLYPRYLHPSALLQCEPEIFLRDLAAQVARLREPEQLDIGAKLVPAE